MSDQLKNIELSTPSGTLSLLTAPIPLSQTTPTSPKPPLLFLHGSFCSNKDYKHFLHFFAQHGYPAYALSIRGHRGSWLPSWTSFMFFQTLDTYSSDLLAAISYIESQHPLPLVLIGHSFGGGMMQHILSTKRAKATALVLLAASPLSGGGKDALGNWSAVEAPNGYKWPWSQRFALDTTNQVRAVFFSEETDESVIEWWLKESKAEYESLRAAMSIMWPFGEAGKVLDSIHGLSSRAGDGDRRKVLCVAPEKDVLVTPSSVAANAEAYRQAGGNDCVDEVLIRRGGHMVTLDVAWEDCAKQVLDWLES